MKPDVVVSWPKNNDYPVWREMMRSNRHRFGQIFVVFTETNDGTDYSQFVKKAMEPDGIEFLAQPPVRDKDWRDVAVNEALRHSFSTWVFFTEQDFFFKDGFFEYVSQVEKHYDVVCVMDKERMHPCGIFMKRDDLNKTHRNFGIVPGVSDHFSLIQKDVNRLKLKQIAIPEKLYTHMNGLSHNFTLLKRGEEPVYKPQEFKNYLAACMNCTVPLSEDWLKIVKPWVEG